MYSLLKNQPPTSEDELLQRCKAISGWTFAQLSAQVDWPIPMHPSQRKGWIGQAIEIILGANARNTSLPDFVNLGVELKTLPISAIGKPTESTFITSIPLLTIHSQTWKTSQCYAKLKRVLWMPIEGDKTIPYSQRRIGQGFIWSPTIAQEAVLAADWDYLTSQISTGQLESLDAQAGDYLQVRPKAAHGKSLGHGFDSKGNKIETLPRGFYLRSRFTAQLFAQYIS